MNYSKEKRKRILDNYISIIERVSNKEYQQRSWVGGIGSDIVDYDDTWNHYDDYQFVMDYYKDLNITENQYQKLKEFKYEFEYFDDKVEIKYSDPKEFLDTPEWAKVMESAKEVLKVFDYKKQ